MVGNIYSHQSDIQVRVEIHLCLNIQIANVKDSKWSIGWPPETNSFECILNPFINHLWSRGAKIFPVNVFENLNLPVCPTLQIESSQKNVAGPA